MSTSVDQILEELGLLDKEAEDNTNQEENFDKELMELIGEDVTDTEKIAEAEEWAKIAAQAFIDECEKLAASKRTKRRAAAGAAGVGAGAALGYYGVPRGLARALKSKRISKRLGKKRVKALKKLLKAGKGKRLPRRSALALALLLGAGGALAAR